MSSPQPRGFLLLLHLLCYLHSFQAAPIHPNLLLYHTLIWELHPPHGHPSPQGQVRAASTSAGLGSPRKSKPRLACQVRAPTATGGCAQPPGAPLLQDLSPSLSFSASRRAAGRRSSGTALPDSAHGSSPGFHAETVRMRGRNHSHCRAVHASNKQPALPWQFFFK